MKHLVKMMQCSDCGHRYPIVPYFPYAAPHGPNRDCRGRDWVEVRCEVDFRGAFVEAE